MSDRIEMDDRIYPGQERWSSNGQYQLIFQEDSNFVLYRKHEDGNMEPIWSTNTYSEDGSTNHSVILQADGNFVMYNADGQPIWMTETQYGASSPYIVVQDDGNVCLYDNNVEGCHWNTGTNQ